MKYMLNEAICYDDGTFVLKKSQCGEKIFLNPGAGRALAFLVANQGRECSKNELVAEIWGKHGFIVGSNSLNQIIVQLRKAFHAIDPDREYIVTIPRVGYKFVAEVATDEVHMTRSEVPDFIATPAIESPSTQPRTVFAFLRCQLSQIVPASQRVMEKLQGLLASSHFVLAFILCNCVAIGFDAWLGSKVDLGGQSFSVAEKKGEVWYHTLRGIDDRSRKVMEATFDHYVVADLARTGRTHVYLLRGAMKITYLVCSKELPTRNNDCATFLIVPPGPTPTL